MISENFVSYRIKQCLSTCLGLSKQEDLGFVTTAIEEIIDALELPMQLAVIGKVSSSNSTLVNAILGKADIVGTGQMEETYNVSWLKYGPSDGDVKVVFNDGTEKLVARKDWKQWSGQEDHLLKDRVKYLEVTYDHEILKKINIIDTPGLDSAKGTDSRNTINFLKEVRPDAVIVVFTEGLAQNTLDVVNDFQGSSKYSFNLTPINAIGVLSKTDFFWKIGDCYTRPNDKAQTDIIDRNIYKLFPEVKNTFFSIYPLSAKIGLASNTIVSRDIELFKRLIDIDEADFQEMLHSANDFNDDYFETDVSLEDRRYLYDKYSLYGIYEAVELAKEGSLSEVSLKSLYRYVSGFDAFESCLYSHFGQRSLLIKTQSASHLINAACERQRNNTINKNAIEAIDKIQESLLTCLMGIFEYKQLDYLNKIYKGNMKITDNSALEEYKRICGEYGNSVVDKLGVDCNITPEELLSLAINKGEEWNAKYQITYYKSRDNAELYHMLSSSYDLLSKDIKEITAKVEEATAVIDMAKIFMYGKK